MQLTETDQQSQARQVIDSESEPIHCMDSYVMDRIEAMLECRDADQLDALIDEIEAHMLSRMECGIGFSEMDSSWTHSNGVSVKTMSLGPCSIVTGAVHKLETINSVIAGEIIIFTPDGPMKLNAGDTFTSSAGVRKIGVTMSGVSFLNAFPNPANERDEAKLEEMYFEPANPYEQIGEFDLFKRIVGIKQDEIDAYMASCGEPLRLECGSIELSDSPIDGTGTLATRKIVKGEDFPVFTKQMDRTILARYSNHSFSPNMVLHGVNAVAVADIKKGEEITMNYLDNFIKTNGNGGMKCLAR
jgi:hypothetical protein